MSCSDATSFRHAVSRFTTGVTVVTSKDQHEQIVGMTANSFMSVSLAPPTILVSVMQGKTLDAIKHRNQFAVNVLPAFAQDISAYFAGQQTRGPTPGFEVCPGMPKLTSSIAYFNCEVERYIEIADHTLLAAKVLDCSYIDKEPLVFFSSQYRNLDMEEACI